jgi:hypothetical protein
LSWRLALLCRNQSQRPGLHETVLAGWYTERKQQLERSLASTIENGDFVTEKNPLKIFVRDMYLWLIQLVPAWLQESFGRRNAGMVRYEYSNGLPFLPEYNGGLCLPQVYCKRFGRPDGEVFFTDDVIFRREKKGLFQLLVYLKSTDELKLTRDIIADVDYMSKGEIRASEATFLVEVLECGESEQGDDVYRLATPEEFAKSPLCEGRPAPVLYDPLYLRKEVKGMRFVVVRQDRFIFAACSTKDDLRAVCSKLCESLNE